MTFPLYWLILLLLIKNSKFVIGSKCTTIGKKEGDTWTNIHGPVCQRCECTNNEIKCRSDHSLCRPRNSLTTRRQQNCTHDGKQRRHKEVWEERGIHSMLIDISEQCMQCLCNESIVVCTTRFCPPVTCSNPIKTKDTCCKKCPEPSISRQKKKGCLHTASFFELEKEWDVYVPNKDSYGTCLKCTCLQQGGGISEKCEQKKCAPLSCAKKDVIGQPGSCCGRCRPGSKRIVAPPRRRNPLGSIDLDSILTNLTPKPTTTTTTPPTFKPRLSNRNNCRLTLVGPEYQHGQKFTPWKEKMIPNPQCILCACSSGKVKCSKLKCEESQHSLHCKKPLVKIPGLCCKVCPGTSFTAGQQREELLKQNTKYMKKYKNNKSCSREHVAVYEYIHPTVIRYLFYRSNAASEIHDISIANSRVKYEMKESYTSQNNLVGYQHIGAVTSKMLRKRVHNFREKMLKSDEPASKLIDDFKLFINNKAKGKQRTCKANTEFKGLPLEGIRM